MRLVRSAIVTLIASCLSFSASVWAAPIARIAQPIDNSRMSTLRGSVHPMARAEFDQGALDASRPMQRMMITFSRSAAQQAEVEKLIAEQQDPNSSFYHQWLTPEEVGERFGMADADLAKMKDWLTSQGFSVEEVANAKNFIIFSGSAGQVNAAFKTEIHQYAVNGEVHFANASSPSVPSAIAGVVSAIRGLDDFKPHTRARRVKPDFTSSLSGNHYLAPDDFATIYNLNALYAAGIDGTGQKIAVMGQTDIIQSDITTFRSVSKLPASSVQVVLVPPDPGTSLGDLQEADLDLEWAGAVAPNASIIYVNAGSANGVFDSLYYAIDHATAPVISISYGLCEPLEGTFYIADEMELENAAMNGQTVVGPAGDDGAADCDYSGNFVVDSAVQGYAVDFPASSPVVTGVGGTAFNEGNGAYWSATNDASQGSALFYIPEVVWNDTLVSVAAQEGLAGTGGGMSVNFAKPTWQTGTNVPNDGARDVPDVAFSASLTNDAYITCSDGSCQVCATTDANCPSATSPGYRLAADGTLDVVGGTSAGVPTFAGVAALINQKTGSSQGTLNPRLYALANGASGSYIFHDITSGDNKVPCVPGTPSSDPANLRCPSGGTLGYSAGVGYDQTTGLGSVDAFNLVTNWSGTPPAADFSVSFFSPSVTVRNGSSATTVLRLQKQNGFSGAVTLACSTSIPGVTCAASPGTVNPDGTTTVTVTSAISVANLRAPVLPNAPSPRQPNLPAWEYAFGLAALVMMGKKRSKREMVVIAMVALGLAGVLTSCGGGGGSGGGGGNTLPSLTASPSSLTFTYAPGGTAPAAQMITVGSSSSALSYTVTASTTSGGNWLSVTPASGATAGMVSVSADPTGLAVGTYSGTVSIAASGASNTPKTVPVTLMVTGPSLTLTPPSLTFSYTLGGAAPAAQNVTVGSSGTAVDYTVTASTTSGGNWLAVTPASGTTSGMTSVSVHPSGLASGTYTGTVSVASTGAGNSPKTLPVTLNIASTTGTVTITATSGGLSHTAQLSLTVN